MSKHTLGPGDIWGYGDMRTPHFLECGTFHAPQF